MGGYGLIRKHLLSEKTAEDSAPVKPKTGKSGYTDKQIKQQETAKSVTAIGAISKRRKAMDEILGK